MSVEDLSQVLSVPGRLAYNPTQVGLAGAWPHGGTAIGYVEGFHVDETEQFAPTRAEEWGQVVGGVRGYSTYAIGFLLAQWDRDMLALLYPAFVSSANSLLDGWSIGERQAGVVPVVQPIVFSPRDLTQPGVLLYAPLPWLGPSGARQLQAGLRTRTSVPAAFLGCRNGQGRTVRWGRLADLPLP